MDMQNGPVLGCVTVQLCCTLATPNTRYAPKNLETIRWLHSGKHLVSANRHLTQGGQLNVKAQKLLRCLPVPDHH